MGLPLFNELKLKLDQQVEKPGMIYTLNGPVPKMGTVTTRLLVGNREIQHTFDVVKTTSISSGKILIFGRDIFPIFRIRIAGLWTTEI
jgi:hypothetical protein